MDKQVQEIINANVEVLEKGLVFLGRLSDEEYNKVNEPLIKSTIGQHIRHVADMYFALMEADENALVDYDKRRRGSQIESVKALGIEAIQQILFWLDTLALQKLGQQSVQIKTEISLQKSKSVTMESSFVRELVFIGSHTVHHYALINVIAKCQGLEIDEMFGMAPATVSYLRNEVTCAQ